VLFLKVKDSQHKCTAGVYLLIRTSPLIEYSSTVLLLCLWIGSITTIFSSLIGLYQQDIKKVIAYSTMSQMAQQCNTHSITFRHQTICVEVKINIINMINSQITKAHNYLWNSYISYSLLNSSLIYWLYNYIFSYITLSVRWKIIIISKLVGISEAANGSTM
jgi:NADH:ubiquinone oxidoreductase subunit 4 (subunit M)